MPISDTLTEDILKELENISFEDIAKSNGRIIKLYDGVAKVSGLKNVSYLEELNFPNGVKGIAFNLEENNISAVILGDYLKLQEGDEVTGSGKLISVPVGDKLIGRVIDPMGNFIDNKPTVKLDKFYPIEKIAPGVTQRSPVDTSLLTGIKAIDSMIPIGRGQRELIIGDRATGKTQIALDTIINQKNKDVICIYVAIGQKMSRIAQVIDSLTQSDAMKHTIFVVASASDPAPLLYLAPYSGSAIAEYFMDQGKDVLIVYDDLSKHAVAYRQVSLILGRPSGREAYPGDIFFLHSRLLERSCKLEKGGSITALPIVETQAGDVSAYIPTNIISITDGQIFLDSDLFNAGIRPAISVGLSVSRVGGKAQIKAMREVAGKLRLDLAQYKDLAAFTQFSSDLDPVTKAQIDRGVLMTELLKQPPFKPLDIEIQITIIWTAINNYLSDIKIHDLNRFQEEFIKFLSKKFAKTLKKIAEQKKLDDKIISELKSAVEEFKKDWSENS